jgi:hypothetical protein
MAQIKAIINADELTFIARCVLDFNDLETGGDYFGYWNKDGMPVIKYVTGPGKKTTRTSTSFYQDIEYLHECGDYIHGKFALEHIGSWHSHHKLGLDHPSGGDVNTMRNCLNTQGVDKFFITICNIISSDEVNINGFLFSNAFRNLYEKSDWVILPDASPYRRQIEDKADFITYPKTKKAKFRVSQTTLNASKKIIQPEKADLPKDSYFDTEEGRKFLKNEFEKIKEDKDASDVEIIQNADKTIGISFKYEGKELEIRYPLDFSEKNPNPELRVKEAEQEVKKHIIEIEPERRYFIRRYNLFDIFRQRFFSVEQPSSSNEGESIKVIKIEIK